MALQLDTSHYNEELGKEIPFHLACSFLLKKKVLLIQVRENESVKEISIRTDEVKLTAHADDITFFILNFRSYNITLDTYKTFHVFSSLS